MTGRDQHVPLHVGRKGEQVSLAQALGDHDRVARDSGRLIKLASGLALWIVYGTLKEDVVIILANGISLTLIGGLLYLKMMQARP